MHRAPAARRTPDSRGLGEVRHIVVTRDRWVGAFLVLVGVVGWFASCQLTIERLLLAADPHAVLNCNFSLLVQCGKNLLSWQGALLGFPNALLGLGGFMAPVIVGTAMLAGLRVARWFWIAFNVGMLLAFALVGFLISQSIFVLGTLCPWCMLVWSVTIPGFLVVTFRNLAAGVFGTRAAGVGSALLSWAVPATVGVYAWVALMAQVRLDVIAHLTS